MRLSGVVIILCISLLVLTTFATAINFASFFKQIFGGKITGQVTSEEETCGEYYSLTPITATASDILSSSYSPSQAIDKNINTHWIGNSSVPYPKWIYFDLGSRKCINSADLYFFQFFLPITVTIQTSNDATAWTTIVSDWSVSQGNSFLTQSFSSVKARYLRVYESSGDKIYGTLTEIKLNAANISTPTAPQENSSNSSSVSVPGRNCFDSDGGKNYFVKGIVNITNANGSSSFYEDGCYSGSGLYEYSWNQIHVLFNTTSCIAGSNQGACNPAPSQVNSAGEQAQSENNTNSIVQSETISSSPEKPLFYCGSYSRISPREAVASSQFNNYRAANAIDGNADTHWFGDTNDAYPKWIYFDLGSKKCINAVELNAFIWDTPINFEIQVSSDARTWNRVGSEHTIVNGGSYSNYDVDEVTARYIRIYEISGKRGYGTLSEIHVNAAPYTENVEERELRLQVNNVIGLEDFDKYYEINGRRAFLEIDGKPVSDYF